MCFELQESRLTDINEPEAELEVWINLLSLQKSSDREKVRQQEALLKRQEQEKKEEEVLGDGDCADGDPAVGDHGDGDHCDDIVTQSSKYLQSPRHKFMVWLVPLKSV